MTMMFDLTLQLDRFTCKLAKHSLQHNK